MELMNKRQEEIIRMIVKEYVKNPKPISSKILAQKLGLSSATLRNEMKELEKAGYLSKPHTSAGRIPTEKGYRLFIKSLGGKLEDTETFEKHFNYLFEQVGEETRVFIGKEIPMIKTKKYSLIVTGFKTPNKKHEIVGLLGPTRMRYDYNIELINKLRELLEDYD